jgi:hypothetical protein
MSNYFLANCILICQSVFQITLGECSSSQGYGQFLEDKSTEYRDDFFQNVGPNLQKLHIDFGGKPSIHSSAIFHKILNNNPHLIYVFAHVQAWGLPEFNVMTKVLLLNLHIYEISPFEGLQWEYNEGRYFPNLEEFNIIFE